MNVKFNSVDMKMSIKLAEYFSMMSFVIFGTACAVKLSHCSDSTDSALQSVFRTSIFINAEVYKIVWTFWRIWHITLTLPIKGQWVNIDWKTAL